MSSTLSEAAIYINYSQAVKQANELDEQAAKLRKIASNDCDRIISQLSREWKGDSASLYLAKCQTLKNELIKSAKKLENTAQSIRTAAKKVKEADLRAKELADLRKRLSK